MTVPVQRGPESDGTGRVLGFVAESLRRLEDSVGRLSSDVNGQLARLPNDYVPRREVERRFDEVCIDLGELRQRADAADKAREAEEKERAAREREVARERRTVRLTLAGLAFTAMSATAGVVFGVINHFQ